MTCRLTLVHYIGQPTLRNALTKLDSPSAVGYERFVHDFTSGIFFLPYTFESVMVLTNPKQFISVRIPKSATTIFGQKKEK